MKFNRGIILLTFLILTTILNISKVMTTQVKRQESMMEYIHNFLKSDYSKSAKNQIKIEQPNNFSFKETESFRERERAKEKELSKLKKKSKYRTYESEEENANESNTKFEKVKNKFLVDSELEAPGLNANTTEREKNPKPILEEWFMISSKVFNEQSRFPRVDVFGKKIQIKTDANNFRINGAYGHELLKSKLPNDKFFWFRLSGLNLYYTSTDTDINILGAIHVESMVEALLQDKLDASTEILTTCFVLKDSERNEWKICGLKEEVVKKWFCQLKTFLNIKDLNNCPDIIVDLKLPPPKIIDKTIEITQPIILVPLEQRHCNDNWTYQKFTSDWECDCKEGHEQSPIDLPEIKSAIESEVKPEFEYTAVGVTDNKPTIDGAIGADGRLKLILKENLFRIFADKFGRIVTMDGSIFHAEEINIHSPSEHKINGKQYDLEITILHSGVSKGDIARQASLSFLFERVPGKYNGFIEDLDYFDLPNPLSTEKFLKKPININNILKTDEGDDISSMTPFSFYTYQGSLTTPPCTEDTIVYVASQPLQIGSAALQLIQEATRVPDLQDVKGNIIQSNWINVTNRPVQPLNGRPVFWFDHTKLCGPKPDIKPIEPSGHYERVRKTFTSYFYVNNDKPSGLPNSYVVSEGEAKGEGPWPKPKN